MSHTACALWWYSVTSAPSRPESEAEAYRLKGGGIKPGTWALKRQVAIKVLPAAVAAGPERLARFQREAEVLAALNHPNIAHIHGLERSDGNIALVMELVEGPTLADRIAQGAIPVEEALPMASKSPTPSKPLTNKGSSTVISNLRISSCGLMAR